MTTRPDYKTYIQSGDWINRCVRFFGDRPSCAVRACRKRWTEGRVGIHHRTYIRLGRESMTDLVPLCWSCHCEAHEWARMLTELGQDSLDPELALIGGTRIVLSEGGSVEFLKTLDAADRLDGIAFEAS